MRFRVMFKTQQRVVYYVDADDEAEARDLAQDRMDDGDIADDEYLDSEEIIGVEEVDT